MPKKKSISKLSERDEDYFKPRALKERALASDGKPDRRDVEDLHNLFALYDKATMGGLRRHCNDVAMERALNNRDKVITAERGVVGERFAFSLPQDLMLFLEKYYPTLWTNKEHTRWFVKRFPMFRK